MTSKHNNEQKIRRLNQMLIISGGLNVAVLALLSFWVIRERPPTPYFELKPAVAEEIALADCRSCLEVMDGLAELPFSQLVIRLSLSEPIENGYKERDLALAAMVAFHSFDLPRALGGEQRQLQSRQFRWKNGRTGETTLLKVFPGLTDQQFASISAFAQTERWPLTTRGVMQLLQKQRLAGSVDQSLEQALYAAPEFLAVELLFNRGDVTVDKQEIVTLVLEGGWPLLNQFFTQQRQSNDLSVARRQRLLLEYLKQGTPQAAYLLLKSDSDMAIRKFDDTQVLEMLQYLTVRTEESEKFALELLLSPRTTAVWQKAAARLYEYAGEPVPSEWNYQNALARFAPDKVVSPVSRATTALRQEPPKPRQESVVKTISKPAVAVKPPAKPAAQPIASVPPRQVAPASARLYVVQEGDSLWKISKRFNVDVEELKKRNQLQSTDLQPGTLLKIP